MASFVRLGDRNRNNRVNLSIFRISQFGNDRVWSEQADRLRRAINGLRVTLKTLNSTRVFKNGSVMLLRIDRKSVV